MNYFNIIVPTLDSHIILKGLIKSIKSQTWQKWKVIFVDGGSKKNHINYLKKICKFDKRFNFLSQSKFNKGIFGAMNQGLKVIDNFSWTIFLGSDDRLIDNLVLENLNSYIINFNLKNKDLIVCRGKYFDISRNIFFRDAVFLNRKEIVSLNMKEYKRFLFYGYTPPHQATLFNASKRNLSCKYDDNFSLAGDLDYFCRLLDRKKLSITNLPINIVHISSGGVSGKKHIQRFKEVIRCYLKSFKICFFIPFFSRYIRKAWQIL